MYRSFEKLNQTIVWYSDISTLAKNTRSPLFLGTIACSLGILHVGINLVSRQLIALVRPHPSLVFLWHKGRNFRAITGDCALARLQNSPYFCVFKYARAVKQNVWNEAENRERDWGEALRACKARALRARKTLTPRFTEFFTDFEKKPDCFAVYALAAPIN